MLISVGGKQLSEMTTIKNVQDAETHKTVSEQRSWPVGWGIDSGQGVLLRPDRCFKHKRQPCTKSNLYLLAAAC